MKIKINHLLVAFLFVLLCFTSCQDEVIQIENPNDQETIVPNSTLANLMSRTTANFGAADNILDGASCFSVELPVTIVVSDITIIIETEADLEQLENVLDDASIDEDVLDFVFPITIIFNDYSQIVIQNEDELDNFIDECFDDEMDTIECADFVYPISFSVFNSGFNLIDTVSVENDEAFYNFLNGLEEDDNALIVSLNFPVTLLYTNGETIEATTNAELANAIEAAEQFCEASCDVDAIELTLQECQWELELYSSFPEFQGYFFKFNSDYSFDIIANGNQVNPEGDTWSVVSNATGSFLVLSTEFEDLAGDWLITECDDDDFKFTKNNQIMSIDQECEADLNCSLSDISGILQECPWDFTDGSGNFENDQMLFGANGVFQISEGMPTSAIGGAWSLSATATGIILTFSELTAFQDRLGGDWLIVECDNDRIEIVREEVTFVLEQDCDGDLFNCFDDFELLECINPNGEAEFNLSADTIGLVTCTESFTASFHTSLSYAESNTNAISNTESYYAMQGEVYLRIEAASGNFEIFTIYLNTETCNLFECFESFDAVLETCYTDAAVLSEFNLDIVFANCTPSADIVTYHETFSDAEANINLIANPSTYNTAELNSIIYTRVEINDQFEIFPIQLNVVNCNPDSCTEGDVNGILTACLWYITSYNGSDNLVDYNFDFEQNTGVVVIYNDTTTIDAAWSLSQPNDLVIIEFSNVTGPNIQTINGSWLVVECTGSQLVLHNVNDSNNEIVLDRICE